MELGNKTAPVIRYPTRERGRTKFEAILNTAEQLLLTREPFEISAYDIAEAMGTSPPTIYHFFPTVDLVFVALAERYLERFVFVSSVDTEPVQSWQQLSNTQADRLIAVYDQHPAVPKVLLGAGYSQEIRRRDLKNNLLLAGRFLDLLNKQFIVPEIPDLLDRLVDSIVITDALLMQSIYQTGRITSDAVENARRARIAYLRTILPEHLSPQTNTGLRKVSSS
jgi:AcrR family transcriptional regulator